MLAGPQEGGSKRWLGRGSDSWQTGEEPGAGVAADGRSGTALGCRHASWSHSRLLIPHGPSAAPTWHCEAHTLLPPHRPRSGSAPRRVPPLSAQKPGHSWLFCRRGGDIPCLHLELECVSPQYSQDKCCLSWKLISQPFLRNTFDLNEGLTGKLCIQITYLGNIFLECKVSLSLQG